MITKTSLLPRSPPNCTILDNPDFDNFVNIIINVIINNKILLLILLLYYFNIS